MIRKLSANFMWISFCYLYIQMLTKLYEIKLTITVCDKFFFLLLQIDRCSEIILPTAKNNFHIICIEVIICSVCRWYIFSLSLSFTDFFSSISEWLTAVLKFLKRFLLGCFQSFCMSLEFASISYHLIIALKNDMFVSPIKEVIKKIF